VPESLTFVLGHTHKPFVDWSDGIGLLNTGGWVVDAPQEQPLHGASAVIVGDDLTTVGLRFYNEGSYEVRVEEPLAPEAPHSDLFHAVTDWIARQPQLYKAFSEATRAEVKLRAENLARRLRVQADTAAAR